MQVDGTSITAVTRGDGRFVLSNVPAGTRRLRATKIGYRPVLQADTVVDPNRASETAIALDAAPATQVRRYRSVEQISFLPVLGATVQF